MLQVAGSYVNNRYPVEESMAGPRGYLMGHPMALQVEQEPTGMRNVVTSVRQPRIGVDHSKQLVWQALEHCALPQLT